MKLLITSVLATVIVALQATPISAQSTSYWSQCTDGASIVRCETYNCPSGDTNKDGLCDLKDDKAQITESRNDSFCANPPSGCGEVLYYADKQSASCAVRVKENNNNCNLYKAGNPNFSTPRPTVSPTPTPVSRLDTSSKSPVPTSTTKPTNTTLPKTGPELWVSIFIAGLGMYGLYLYEKPRKGAD